jgi:hypothetical protein
MYSNLPGKLNRNLLPISAPWSVSFAFWDWCIRASGISLLWFESGGIGSANKITHQKGEMAEDGSGHSAGCPQATLEVNIRHKAMQVAFLLCANRSEDLCGRWEDVHSDEVMYAHSGPESSLDIWENTADLAIEVLLRYFVIGVRL